MRYPVRRAGEPLGTGRGAGLEAAFRLALPICLLLVCAACDGTSEPPRPRHPTPLDLTRVGTLSGTVFFDGPAPEPSALRLGGWSECAAQHDGPVAAADVLVTDGRLQNAIVYIEDGLGERVFAVPERPVVSDQQGCRFLPRILAAQVDQPIRFLNSDPLAHNVHGLPTRARPWNFSLGLKGTSRMLRVGAEEVGIEIKCDIHGWMRSYLSVFDHPYFALSAADGTFTLADVPPGQYTVAAWHERFGTRSQAVVLGEREEADVTFRFSAVVGG